MGNHAAGVGHWVVAIGQLALLRFCFIVSICCGNSAGAHLSGEALAKTEAPRLRFTDTAALFASHRAARAAPLLFQRS